MVTVNIFLDAHCFAGQNETCSLIAAYRRFSTLLTPSELNTATLDKFKVELEKRGLIVGIDEFGRARVAGIRLKSTKRLYAHAGRIRHE